MARSRQDPGKGCYWAINHLHSVERQGGFEKKKKSFLVGPEWAGAGLEQLRQSLVSLLVAGQAIDYLSRSGSSRRSTCSAS